MIDTSHVDMVTLAGAHTELRRDGHQHAGPCPFCGGKDRFYVESGRWGCRHCAPGWNDALTFVARRDGLDLKTSQGMTAALAALNIANAPRPAGGRQSTRRPENEVGNLREDYGAFDSHYQAMADQFVTRSFFELRDNRKVWDYLVEQRGIEKCVLDSALIGFNYRPSVQRWGAVEVFTPRGIVIPWVEGRDTYWRMRFRTREGYKQATGAANGLYQTTTIKPGSVVVLVEGEFDALSLRSALVRHNRANRERWVHHIVGVATGGTTQGRALRHVTQLALAHRVLVAYDIDEPGQVAAKWWLDRLPNAVRWSPIRQHKDINDMVKAGLDMAAWVRAGVRYDYYPRTAT